MPKLRIYAGSDGTRLYAVATTSQKLACDLLHKSGRLHGVTPYQLRTYGFTWNIGQVDGTEAIAAKPGTVFREAISQGRRWHELEPVPA